MRTKLLADMMNYKNLSEPEQWALQHFLEGGYAQAAQSLSQLIRKNVVVRALRFDVLDANNGDCFGQLPVYYYGKTMSLMQTDIMGQAQGQSYLLLSDQERQFLRDAELPADASAEMEEAFVKEVDNMLSAAAISEFSTGLRILIFGGVPQLHSLPQVEMEEFFGNQLSVVSGGHHLFSSARLVVDEVPDVQPQFFWKLAPTFLDHLAKYVQEKSIDAP